MTKAPPGVAAVGDAAVVRARHCRRKVHGEIPSRVLRHRRDPVANGERAAAPPLGPRLRRARVKVLPAQKEKRARFRARLDGPLIPRPRRAEQVPSASCLDATPERDAAPQWSACLRAPSRSHPHPSLPTSLPSGERRLEAPFSSWEKGGDEGIGAPAQRFGAPLPSGEEIYGRCGTREARSSTWPSNMRRWVR